MDMSSNIYRCYLLASSVHSMVRYSDNKIIKNQAIPRVMDFELSFFCMLASLFAQNHSIVVDAMDVRYCTKSISNSNDLRYQQEGLSFLKIIIDLENV